MSDISKRFLYQAGRRITPGCGPMNKMNMYVMFSVNITKRMYSSSDILANYGQMR